MLQTMHLLRAGSLLQGAADTTRTQACPPITPPRTTCVRAPCRSSKTTPGTTSVVTKPALGTQVNSALQNHPHFCSKKGTKITRKKMQKLRGYSFPSPYPRTVISAGKDALLHLCTTQCGARSCKSELSLQF